MLPGPPSPWTLEHKCDSETYSSLKHPQGNHKRGETCLAPEVINIPSCSRTTFLMEASETCPALTGLYLRVSSF